jgi:hypothetical protein
MADTTSLPHADGDGRRQSLRRLVPTMVRSPWLYFLELAERIAEIQALSQMRAAQGHYLARRRKVLRLEILSVSGASLLLFVGLTVCLALWPHPRTVVVLEQREGTLAERRRELESERVTLSELDQEWAARQGSETPAAAPQPAPDPSRLEGRLEALHPAFGLLPKAGRFARSRLGSSLATLPVPPEIEPHQVLAPTAPGLEPETAETLERRRSQPGYAETRNRSRWLQTEVETLEDAVVRRVAEVRSRRWLAAGIGFVSVALFGLLVGLVGLAFERHSAMLHFAFDGDGTKDRVLGTSGAFSAWSLAPQVETTAARPDPASFEIRMPGVTFAAPPDPP